MDMHFEYARKEKAHLRDRIQLCDVALALIDEQRQLVKLLRANPVSEYGNKAFKAPLKRLTDLERVSHGVGLVFRGRVATNMAEAGALLRFFGRPGTRPLRERQVTVTRRNILSLASARYSGAITLSPNRVEFSV
jgi:hypothetical protein